MELFNKQLCLWGTHGSPARGAKNEGNKYRRSGCAAFKPQAALASQIFRGSGISLSKSGLRWQAIFFTERVLLPQRLAFISNHDGRGVAAAAALRELPCSMHAPSPARSLLAPKEPRRRLRPEGASPAASLEGASPAASLEGAWPAASLVGACPLKGLNSSQLGCARRTRCCGRPAATLLHSSQQS